MKIGTIFIVFICLVLSASCQKKVIMKPQQPIDAQIHDIDTIMPPTPKDKKQTEPISLLPFNLLVKYYKDYQEETLNGIIMPIQIKNNQLEFIQNNNLNQLNLTNFSTLTTKNFFLQTIVDTNYPPELPGDWIISDQQYYYYLSTKKQIKTTTSTLPVMTRKQIELNGKSDSVNTNLTSILLNCWIMGVSSSHQYPPISIFIASISKTVSSNGKKLSNPTF